MQPAVANRRFSPSILLSLTFLFLLSGCGDRVELHRQLSEQEANEVIAELADKHIRAKKIPAKDGVTVSVDTSDIGRAVRTLEAVGLPRIARATLGDTFRKEGVISTPLEERARYIYALSQELEATLSNIDGVIVARVHVVLPERIAPGEPVQPASAAVFIKHDPRLDPDNIRVRVRRMVASSIPGMTTAVDNPQKLTVIFVPAAAYQEQKRLVYLGPFLIPSDDRSFWWTSFVIVLGGLIFTAAGSVFLLNRRQRLNQVTPASDVTAGPAHGH